MISPFIQFIIMVVGGTAIITFFSAIIEIEINKIPMHPGYRDSLRMLVMGIMIIIMIFALVFLMPEHALDIITCEGGVCP